MILNYPGLFPQYEVVVVEGNKNFNPQRCLISNKEIRYSLSEEFNIFIKDPARPMSLSQIDFMMAGYMAKISDNQLMNYLKISRLKGLLSKEKIIWTIDFLTKNQANGETGFLPTKNNCSTIIGYTLCNDGEIRVVNTYFFNSSNTWYIDCLDIIDPFIGGDQFLIEKKLIEVK